ncbi:MAG: GNAT family N-acetyltransferase [Defluviitaleaceae bacterium]|nr:GNAT family N-acetyltransferase [Defluviitaleaceae bacterium]
MVKGVNIIETTTIYEATKEEQNYIDSCLGRYNNSKVPFTQNPTTIYFNKCIKDGDEVIGGILSYLYCWNILNIDVLWVKDEHRNKGFARALVDAVESEARAMGCHISHLDTFDWQAKELYEKLGYVVFGVLENCPEGHNRYYMSKKL